MCTFYVCGQTLVIACVLWNAFAGRRTSCRSHFFCIVGLEIKFEQTIGALARCLSSPPNVKSLWLVLGKRDAYRAVCASLVCGTVKRLLGCPSL